MGFTQTTTYDKPALCFPIPAGVTPPANLPPDNADPNLVIPMTLTGFTVPSRKSKTQLITSIPLKTYTTAFGGTTVAAGTQEFRKSTLEGTIDTPITDVGSGVMLPSLTISDGTTTINAHYALFIGKCLDGSINSSFTWQVRLDPIWFRDPYGRRWDSVQIIDFNASYVEAAPNRTNFSATMVLV